MQLILLSARLRWSYTRHPCQMARPRAFDAQGFIACDRTGAVGFHGLAVLRGRITAVAPQAAIAS